ncbi:hypothetical protein C8N35_104114 [Breoghania corrubedonensis]|uniref:Uncharacterized protein n=1 Tax=Breoghania corrubedonensis TaxID=665038 RepID=A0A2T5V9T6_9HYPH|nr:hypothetical protein C8N35_104114 [Breoghania corrubedonensis]
MGLIETGHRDTGFSLSIVDVGRTALELVPMPVPMFVTMRDTSRVERGVFGLAHSLMIMMVVMAVIVAMALTFDGGLTATANATHGA